MEPTGIPATDTPPISSVFYFIKAMDDVGVIMTPFRDIVAVILVGNSLFACLRSALISK